VRRQEGGGEAGGHPPGSDPCQTRAGQRDTSTRTRGASSAAVIMGGPGDSQGVAAGCESCLPAPLAGSCGWVGVPEAGAAADASRYAGKGEQQLCAGSQQEACLQHARGDGAACGLLSSQVNEVPHLQAGVKPEQDGSSDREPHTSHRGHGGAGQSQRDTHNGATTRAASPLQRHRRTAHG
jgi:hypothetical protein